MSVDTSNATFAAGADQSRARIAGAIKQAATTTGTSFQYLLATAKMESDFNPKATATTSSAAGLFQFIDQTWLGTIKEAGAQLGYGQYANAITRSSAGTYSVSDPAARRAILNLRDDPDASSAMAGVLTQSNSFKLTGMIGRRPTESELYMAHFMGVHGAARLITNAEDNPQASGARLFPNAAAANLSIFYDHAGRARSISEVYSVLSARYAGAASSQATRAAMASVGVTSAGAGVAAAAPVDNAAYLSSFPQAGPGAPVTLASATSTTSAPPVDPIFRSLFQAGERAQPISPAIHELWGNASSPTAGGSAAPAAPPASMATGAAPQLPGAGPAPSFDLFSDPRGRFSS
jgi:transglycosylase-like protein with SLT domain